MFHGYRHFDANRIERYQGLEAEFVNVPLLVEDELAFGVQNAYKELARLGISPSALGLDILTLALLVYLADTRVSRSRDSQDSWTREISILHPVSDLEKWEECAESIERQLTFLTGDIWKIVPYKDDYTFDTLKMRVRQVCHPVFDTVSLFSGGMDSLIFAIDSLDSGQRPLFVSHADSSNTKSVQKELLSGLSKYYPDCFSQVNLWTSFPKDIVAQSGLEDTTRSRSFLFIAYALFSITGMPSIKKLVVPENGLIALNVPLDPLRLGSHSTRTTHPFYLDLWNEHLAVLGIDATIENPYWDLTKGEMAERCANPDLLQELLPVSMSCSSPTKYRWKGLPPQHCGHCIPCIIRRASIHKAFGGDETEYVYNNLDVVDKKHDEIVGEHLRAFRFAISELKRKPGSEKSRVLVSGPLRGDVDYVERLAGVYSRGLAEVDAAIESDKNCSI